MLSETEQLVQNGFITKNGLLLLTTLLLSKLA